MKSETQNTTICFLADKHDLYDDRIYWKMAVPLKEKGYNVHYLLISDTIRRGITPEGIHYEILKTKTISKNKYLNFILKFFNPFNNYTKLFEKAKALNADIYHFHDLWINKIGGKLKRLKHKPVVFYDVHEPYAEDYISYSNVTGVLKLIVEMFAFLVDKWEKNKAKKYDLIITTEEIVRDNFRRVIGIEKAEVIYNFTENYNLYNSKKLSEKKIDFIYSGGITKLRGAFKILEATLKTKQIFPNVKVVFIGKYSPLSLKDEMQDFISKHNLTDNVELHSFINYSKISNYYNNSKVGFITPLPEPSFKIKMYIKIFEYMAFGLPIIGSNFGHIKEYVEKEKCGILVDPESSVEISNSMVQLLTDIDKYNFHSRNGRLATLEKYRWELELKRLINFYEKALNERG